MEYEILYLVNDWPVHAQIVRSRQEAERMESEFVKSASEIHPITAKTGNGFNCQITQLSADKMKQLKNERVTTSLLEKIQGNEEFYEFIKDLKQELKSLLDKENCDMLSHKIFIVDKAKKEMWNKIRLRQHYAQASSLKRDRIKAFFESAFCEAREMLNIPRI